MKYFLPSLFILFNLACNGLTMTLVYYKLNDIDSKTIYNMDRARQQFLTDAEFYYTKGCHFGAEYPKDIKPNEFDPGSPMMYCGREYETNVKDLIINDAYKLGIKEN